ncbi:MarR family winged helix-turn-helix transcriptional regulator [Cellulomonas cellasea]|uniref:MarR family transcriptional regulator n=2 Tax=Cellulomonas cellasea TaxID=43670 RepID=A0A0A0B3I4_9CELL|nr:MarR family transcriptional regulator [Cellulomonas cellasea]KGM00752.1 MarR family transcriptional regulator [Cellulomonas cellasea DSM 20118]GEA86399.1 transcriptional regulator [Cellulomonas cellasea]
MTSTDAPTERASRRAASTDVRWLSAEEQTHWRAFRDGTALLLDVLGRELDDDSGLSLGEYEVLVRLSEAPDRTLRMSELAGELAHSRSRLTHTIRRMESDGLVARTPCAEDARGVNCTMTDAGWQRIVDAAPGHVEAVRANLVDVLTPAQLAALGEAMGVVIEHLRSAGGPRSSAGGSGGRARR